MIKIEYRIKITEHLNIEKLILHMTVVLSFINFYFKLLFWEGIQVLEIGLAQLLMPLFLLIVPALAIIFSKKLIRGIPRYESVAEFVLSLTFTVTSIFLSIPVLNPLFGFYFSGMPIFVGYSLFFIFLFAKRYEKEIKCPGCDAKLEGVIVIAKSQKKHKFPIIFALISQSIIIFGILVALFVPSNF